MNTDRFGRYNVLDDDLLYDNKLSLPSFRSLFTVRFCLVITILYISFYFIGKSITASSEEALRPVSSSEARLVCETKNIESEQGIHAGYLSYGNTEKLSLQLYTVSITRTISCVDSAMETHSFQYKDDYLNISTVNVDKVYASLVAEYPIGKSFILWYYAKHCHWIRERLDRNCLSPIAIEPDEYTDSFSILPYTLLVHSLSFFLLCTFVYAHIVFKDTCLYKCLFFK